MKLLTAVLVTVFSSALAIGLAVPVLTAPQTGSLTGVIILDGIFVAAVMAAGLGATYVSDYVLLYFERRKFDRIVSREDWS